MAQSPQLDTNQQQPRSPVIWLAGGVVLVLVGIAVVVTLQDATAPHESSSVVAQSQQQLARQGQPQQPSRPQRNTDSQPFESDAPEEVLINDKLFRPGPNSDAKRSSDIRPRQKRDYDMMDPKEFASPAEGQAQAMKAIVDGELEYAREVLTNALESSPGDFRLVQLYMDTYFREGKEQRGVELVRQFVEKHPEKPELKMILARGYQSMGHTEDALRELREFLEMAPESMFAASAKRQIEEYQKRL